MDTATPHAFLNLLFWTFVAFFAVMMFVSAVCMCQEYERAVIFRFGRYKRVSGPGLFLKWPLIESRRDYDLRVVTADIGKQEMMTSDNVPIKVQAVVWFNINDAALVRTKVENHKVAVVEAASTNLRIVLGQNSLKQIMSEQIKLAGELRGIIDAVTEPWGVAVINVQLKDVEIPPSMQRAMAQVAEAGREKEARVIRAQAEEEAATAFARAAGTLAGTPGALELRRLQTLQQIGAEQNTMVLVPFPIELAQAITGFAKAVTPQAATPRAEPERPPQPAAAPALAHDPSGSTAPAREPVGAPGASVAA